MKERGGEVRGEGGTREGKSGLWLPAGRIPCSGEGVCVCVIHN